MEEPGKEKSTAFYDLITYNVRITRDLNNIHLEQDEKRNDADQPATPAQQQRINHCLDCFNLILSALPGLDPSLATTPHIAAPTFIAPFRLNEVQMISLEKLIIELKTMHGEMATLVVRQPHKH